MIKCSRESLLYPLSKVADVTRGKGTLPILTCVLIESAGGQLTLTATDLEQQLVASDPTEMPAFRVCVDAKKLMDALRSLPEAAAVEIGVGASVMTIASGKTRFRFQSRPPEEFPAFDPTQLSGSFSAAATDLRRAFDGVQSSMADRDVRFYLNGACFSVSGTSVEVVASDGHTMALFKGMAIGGADLPPDRALILPRNAVFRWAEALPADGDVTVALYQSSACLQLPGLACWTRLIDGRFPDYRRIIAPQFPHEWRVNLADLTAAIGRCRNINAGSKAPAVAVTSGDGVLSLRATSPGEDEVEDEIAAEGAEPGVEFGIRADYVIEAAAAVDAEVGIWQISPHATQTLLRAESGGTGAQRIIMPMRL